MNAHALAMYVCRFDCISVSVTRGWYIECPVGSASLGCMDCASESDDSVAWTFRPGICIYASLALPTSLAIASVSIGSTTFCVDIQ